MAISDYSQELAVATLIAHEAGALMLRYFDGDQKQQRKADGSPVTIADKQINQMVIAKLIAAFPDDGIVGEEESTSSYGMGRKWLCDPIDGTKSYIWGIPTAMFSLALVIDGRPVVGVAYDPFLNKLYTGVVGQGSYCNGEKLTITPKPLNKGAIALTGSVERILSESGRITALGTTGAEVVSFDGAVYKATLVARGRLVAYIGQGCGPYDIAAAEVIVTEAGGKVTNLAGHPLDYSQDFIGVLVSGNAHQELVDALVPLKA